jgi:hypothetical protein
MELISTPVCMDLYSVHLINDNEEDYLVSPEYIGLTHKIFLIRKLHERLDRIRTLDAYSKWLLLFHGDLEGRETRKISWLDECQIRQIYDYITLVLEIRLPPFDLKRHDSNRHLWQFYQSVFVSNNYRVSSNPQVSEFLKREWDVYTSRAKQARSQMLRFERDAVEDCYYIRGKWVGNHEVITMKKAIEEERPFYNIIRGKHRFEKLFGYHGKRVELVESYNEWKKLCIEYGPDYLLSQKGRVENDEDFIKEGCQFFEEWIRELPELSEKFKQFLS